MITATQAIGNAFDSKPIKIFGTVLSVMLVVVWIYVFGMMLRALALRRLLWPEEVDGTEMMQKKWAKNVSAFGRKRHHLNPFRQRTGVLQS